MEDTKVWWASRTVWVGLIGAVFAVAGILGVLPEGLTQEQVLQGVMAVVGVLVVVFRVTSSKSLTLTK